MGTIELVSCHYFDKFSLGRGSPIDPNGRKMAQNADHAKNYVLLDAMSLPYYIEGRVGCWICELSCVSRSCGREKGAMCGEV